jgi:4-amino-4-deoxy-L-arabinose transferase-like glycosyltransferase
MTSATLTSPPPEARPAPRLERPALALPLVLTVAALIVTAGSFGLFEPTETRYAEIAREMRAAGDYVVPRLDGIAHYHKPPFAYWATAAGMTLFGENGWGARLPVAAATACTLLFMWIAVRRRFGGLDRGVPAQRGEGSHDAPPDPALTVWMMATMALPFALGRTLGSDAFLAAAVAGFWALAPSPAAIGMLGLGFLIKGPVVLVPTLLPVLAAAAWARSRASLRLLGPGWSWTLFAVIGLPWYVVSVAREPGLLGYWLQTQLWQRVTTHVYHREGPPWYFVVVLLVGALPWTVALVAGVARVWRARAREDSRLLLAWLFVPLVLFSLSTSKLPAYILPCFPAVAALVANGLERSGRIVRVVTATTLVLLAAGLAVIGPRVLARSSGAGPGEGASLPAIAYLGLALWVVAAFAVIRARHAWASGAVLAGWVGLMFGLARYEAPLGSPRPLVQLLADQRARGEPVVEYLRFNAGVPFYLREQVRLLDVERELFFTPREVRAGTIVTRDSLAPLAARHGRVWLLAPNNSGATLASSLGLDYRRVTRWRNLSLGFLETPRR